jgi:chemotaxis protein histidine kinase CheA
MSAQYQTIISKSMEQSFVTCIQQTVKLLAETYSFDYEEALALFGTDDLKVATNLGKTKGVVTGSAPKRTKPKFPLPFTGEVFDDCCHAIVFNSGLFTQCLKAPKPDSQNSLCQTCEKQAEKNPNGSPSLGFISDRVERGEDWADPRGRRPVPYTKVMKAKKFTQEEVMAQVRLDNTTIDITIFDEPDTDKRGRKGGKKTEAQAVFEDDEDTGMMDELIQQVKDSESETSEASKTSKTSKTSKKSKEERESEKLEKASQKSELDMMKAEEKRMKELRKEEERLAKEHERQIKEQQKEAIRLLKERKEEEKRLAKEAKEQEKAAKELEKAAKAQAKADAKRPIKQINESKMVDPVVEPVEESEEVDPLEELEEAPPSPLSPPPEESEPVVEPEPVVLKPKMKKFKFQGVSYVVDDANIVYRKDSPKVRVGIYTEDGLVFDEKDEEESEDDLSDIE